MSKKHKYNQKPTSTQNTNSKKPILNGITDFTRNMIGTSQLSQTDTLRLNNRYYYIFNDRQLLSSLYVEHGIIQTLIDAPVDDAFRKGFKIKTGQLSGDEIKNLENYLKKENVIEKIQQTLKWGRLYGGGGLVIITSQNPSNPFDIEKITKNTPIELYSADLWELNMQYYKKNPSEETDIEKPYMFYGTQLHKTRVLDYKGKMAPSFIRKTFRGWGMSEVERLVRSFSQYLKNNDVIFELLDEAKVDVYKLENFSTSLLSGADQQAAIENRVQLSNSLKNYLNALVMDVNDNYEQKQLTFSGLGDMLEQIRKGIASDLKFPISKLFGEAPTGLSNSDESGQENYNSLVEGEVRAKSESIIIEVLNIYCKKIFDIIPDDISIEWPALRILNAEQEENVKNSKLNRLITLFSSGLISTKELKECVNSDHLVAVEIKVDDVINESAAALNMQTSNMSFK